ncbi:class I SAM-dependent methyltransferase [Bordetella genomosp. 13]|uniref:class I SAM-dependent methyltransferase n=1 Tax=Bordetella genomosp. 13 TaxID=463040 RepID=UPI0011A07231|nr:class I SAM-dependent methyltransferase [Bordetella genomosp. 13]
MQTPRPDQSSSVKASILDRLPARLAGRAKRLLFRLSPALAERCNVEFRLHAPNRQFLENEIFGFLGRHLAAGRTGGRCLFIGLDRYNWHYHRALGPGFHSIDIKSENAVYGQPGRHVVGCATQLSRHYAADSFDVIVANGLIGYGLNRESDFDRMMQACHRVLAPGGVLVLGYNDRPDRLPFRAERVAGYRLLEEFTPPIEGVHGAHHRIEDGSRHKFVFLRKPGTARAAARAARWRTAHAPG